MSDEILPKQSEIYQLGAAQLADLQKFIAASDARPEDASLRYSTAIKRMDDLAVVDGIDPTGGKIAATAAQIGTLRGDP